jgi:hypothetical protein
MHLKNWLFLLLFTSLTGWIGAQSSAKYMKIVPQADGTLYFIKPIKMKNPDGAKLEVDFTYFDAKTEPTGKVDMKFSIYSKIPIKTVDKVVFYYQKDQTVTSLEGVMLMYTEQAKGKWISRFDAMISLADLKTLMQPGQEPELWPIVSEQTLKKFPGGKNWEKVSENIWGIFATML